MGILKKLTRPKKAEGAQTRPFCSAVVAAAGQSSRMLGENKLFSELADQPVLIHTLLALEACPEIDEIVVAARSEDILTIGGFARTYGLRKLTRVVQGGESRTASVYSAALETNPAATLIAVHDAARPLVTPALIGRVVAAAAESSAAIPAVPVKDTVKVVRDGFVASTPVRAELMAAQTPQVFEAPLLKCALADALDKGKDLTDDCAAVEAMGIRVRIVPGDPDNIKITTPEDLAVARALLERRVDALE